MTAFVLRDLAYIHLSMVILKDKVEAELYKLSFSKYMATN